MLTMLLNLFFLSSQCDQQKQGLVTMPAKMDEYCKQHGFAGWFETSAKDNVNIEESAKTLVSKVSHAQQPDAIS